MRTGSGQGGPCLTDAAPGGRSRNAVRGLPLRRGPSDATTIIAARLARWRHVLSFIGSSRGLRDPREPQRMFGRKPVPGLYPALAGAWVLPVREHEHAADDVSVSLLTNAVNRIWLQCA